MSKGIIYVHLIIDKYKGPFVSYEKNGFAKYEDYGCGL